MSESAPPQVLPRGRHAAPRNMVEASQRFRLLEAMAVAVAEHGYVHTAVADVLTGAGVGRRSFSEHFPNMEACFLAASDPRDGVPPRVDRGHDCAGAITGLVSEHVRRHGRADLGQLSDDVLDGVLALLGAPVAAGA